MTRHRVRKEPKDRVKAAISALSRRYARELPERVAEVRRLFEAVKSAPVDLEVRERLRRRVHALKGSGATFGFPAISREAGRLETELERWESAQGAPMEDDLAHAQSLLDALASQASLEADRPRDRVPAPVH